MVKSHNNTQLFVVVWYLILEFLLDQLRAICKEYQERIQKIESEKYDLEKQVEAKGYEVCEYNNGYVLVIKLSIKFIIMSYYF